MQLGDQYIGRAVRKAHIESLPKLLSQKHPWSKGCVCVWGEGRGGGVDRCDFKFEPRHVHGCISVSVCVVLPRAMTETIRNADTRLPHEERMAN